ncbi:MAG: phenylacetate--CoA ligase family protein [Caldisericia bacterium]|nr:phenylacetate--CoA ligase family protein [Caldisericia bacterium]
MSSNAWIRRDIEIARRLGVDVIAERQRSRFIDIVAFARQNSAYYKELYKDLPENIDNPRLLPVTDKKKLMARFDDWCTDSNVTLAKVRSFIDNPNLVGEPFLGKYLAVTSSGTTGTRGLFLIDDVYSSVNSYLFSNALHGWLNVKEKMQILGSGVKIAILATTGGHFASCAGYTRMCKTNLFARWAINLYSVQTPIPELVKKLNKQKPAIIFGYGSAVRILAQEQVQGRLNINPVLIIPSGESLGEHEYDQIKKHFRHSKISNLYGASECSFIGSMCKHGWYHVNSDWVIIEPVNQDYTPTRPGELSHTVLLTNLANKVQPILRYDLGDRVLTRADSCPCGNPLPAIQIIGRAADIMHFATLDKHVVSIPPLAFATLVDSIPGIKQFQIAQTTGESLSIRLNLIEGADSERVWQSLYSQISKLLSERELNHISIVRSNEPPLLSPSGKLRTIIPIEANF